MVQRLHNRPANQIRPVILSTELLDRVPGSVLFQLGMTKVLCSVTLQETVPSFLKGKGVGWLTAEYEMLPIATHTRSQRESATWKKKGRTVEISRLIGRSLRASVNLAMLGERTLLVDCDVLQADGGTRTAAITGASYALRLAQGAWLAEGLISQPFITEQVIAISAGIVAGAPLLDLAYEEDSQAEVDVNFVMTASGKLIELQGTAEQAPMTWDQFEQLRALAISGVEQAVVALNMN